MGRGQNLSEAPKNLLSNIFTSLYLFEASLQDQWRQIHNYTSIINAVWSKDWWRIFATSYCVKHCWKVLWCERKSFQYLCWKDSEKQKLVLICLRLSIVLDFFFSIIHERWIIMFEKTYWEKKIRHSNVEDNFPNFFKHFSFALPWRCCLTFVFFFD